MEKQQRGYTKDTLEPAPPFVEIILDKPRRLRFNAFAGERFETLRGKRMTLLGVVLALEIDPAVAANPLSIEAQAIGKQRLEYMSQYSLLVDVLIAGLLHEEEIDRKQAMEIITAYEDNGGDILGELWPCILEALQNSRMIQCLLQQTKDIERMAREKLAEEQGGDDSGNPDGEADENSSNVESSPSPNGATVTG